MTHREVIVNIKQICNLSFDMDAEQVLDIIMGRAEVTTNKTSSYQEIVSDWQASDWKSVLREFYVSFQKSKLSEVLLDEYDHTMRPDVVVESQKQLSQYKKAPDSYYLHLANLELQPPVEAKPVQNTVVVLLSLYAAIAHGENYGTVSYPPQRFIDEVVGESMTPSEYLATLRALSESDTTLEAQAAQAVENNAEVFKKMRTAYRKLVGTDAKTTATKMANAAANATSAASVKAEKAMRKVYTPEEAPTKKVSALVLIAINGLAIPVNLIFRLNGIGVLFAEYGMASLLDIIDILGLCLVPIVGLICAISKKKSTRLLSTGCAIYSVYSLVKVVVALIISVTQGAFSFDNICKLVVTSPFGG